MTDEANQITLVRRVSELGARPQEGCGRSSGLVEPLAYEFAVAVLCVHRTKALCKQIYSPWDWILSVGQAEQIL